ncbi:hypothetical protein LCGC14_3008320 [marine sediment metagenome]|uniref:Uncharacterized protein n=1 Tax=marine sediment metagenome TaxID=412755 RepID=A0A0F8Z6L4_9ZZZZ
MALFPTRTTNDLVSAADYNLTAKKNFEQDGSVASQQSVQTGVSGVLTIDCDNGEDHRITLTGAVTGLTVNNAQGAQVLHLTIIDSGGPHAWVYTGTTVEVANVGTLYATTSGAGQKDQLTLIRDDATGAYTQTGKEENIA